MAPRKGTAGRGPRLGDKVLVNGKPYAVVVTVERGDMGACLVAPSDKDWAAVMVLPLAKMVYVADDRCWRADLEDGPRRLLGVL